MTVERRRYPRVEITWPVTVITPNGPKFGIIQNMSLGGALIQCTKVPELDDYFRLVIRPAECRYIYATARIVWSGTFSNDKSMFHAMGVRFKRTPSFWPSGAPVSDLFEVGAVPVERDKNWTKHHEV